MANVHATINIDAPVQDVWDVATDVGRMSEWVSIHRDFPGSTPDSVAVGTTFQQTLSVAGTPFGVEWTATEVNGPESLAWEGTGPAGTTARTRYALTSENGGTRFSYENEFKLPAGKVGEAAAGVVHGQAEREAKDSLAALKQLIES
jgi:ligand-binding SRPBCC domain-containing protein